MKLKPCLVSVAITTFGAWAPQAFSGENSTCYGMYVVDVYHCSPGPFKKADGTTVQGNGTIVATAYNATIKTAAVKDASGNYPAGTSTVYSCFGTATKYLSQKNRNKNKSYLTEYAPIPIVPTSPANGGVSPANPDPRTSITSKGGVIYDPGTTTNRYPEKGADRLRTSIEASYCHSSDASGAYNNWRDSSKALCGYALPLSAYQQAGMSQNTFSVTGAQANDFAVITGNNTIWKDDTHPKVWRCPT